jgi:hypothetical protein
MAHKTKLVEKEIVKLIFDFAEENNISVYRLAKDAGLPWGTVNNIRLSGNGNLLTVQKIATAAGLTLEVSET